MANLRRSDRGGEGCVEMRRLAILLTLLAGQQLLPQVPAAAKSCYAYVAPSYDSARMAVNFLIDIENCWQSDRLFVMRGSIIRESGLEDSIVSRKAKCAPSEACRLQLFMEHPEIELADYSLSIKFRPSPRAHGKVEQRHELTCLSGAYHTNRCFD